MAGWGGASCHTLYNWSVSSGAMSALDWPVKQLGRVVCDELVLEYVGAISRRMMLDCRASRSCGV